MGGTQIALIAALAATTQAVFAQHCDFAPKVQVIIDYLKSAGDGCVSPAFPGERSFKACREGSDPVSLTVATRIPIRDSNGRVIDTCPAKLTAVQLPGLLSVRFDVAAVECPESTLKSGSLQPFSLASSWNLPNGCKGEAHLISLLYDAAGQSETLAKNVPKPQSTRCSRSK